MVFRRTFRTTETPQSITLDVNANLSMNQATPSLAPNPSPAPAPSLKAIIAAVGTVIAASIALLFASYTIGKHSADQPTPAPVVLPATRDDELRQWAQDFRASHDSAIASLTQNLELVKSGLASHEIRISVLKQWGKGVIDQASGRDESIMSLRKNVEDLQASQLIQRQTVTVPALLAW